jgi:3-phosphoshikimate 1-carboxyvinyltransferase
MVTYSVTKKDRNLSGEVSLAPSKSISNRKIVIRAVKNAKLDIKNLADKEADKLFDENIRQSESNIELGQTGVAIRLLRAVLTYFGGEWIVTGSEEMRKRPIGDVIELLQANGFDIKFLERTGFPPLKIIAKGFRGSISRIEAAICGQFVTVTLSISPSLSTDDFLGLRGKIKNSPYVTQTFKMLNMLGINSGWKMDEMLIDHGYHDGSELAVEADWTSAGYWYEMAALAENVDLKINGMNPDSIQSDAIVKEIFEPLGVKTEETENGISLKKVKCKLKKFEYDFTNNPNLVPTLIATCVGMGLPFEFTGVDSLRLKDSDRLMVLQSQMAVVGAELVVKTTKNGDVITFDGKVNNAKKEGFTFNTFDDHRVLMSLAPLTLSHGNIGLDYPNAVHKSYPCFWQDLKKVGFEVEQKNS